MPRDNCKPEVSVIPGKTLQELKEEAKKIGQKIEKDKKIFEKYLTRKK